MHTLLNENNACEHKGAVIWICGLSGSGKTTLAKYVERLLEKTGCPVTVLDGDIVREFFDGDLGYTREERVMNIKRIGFAANLLSETGRLVFVANIAPYEEARSFLRKKISRLHLVYLNVELSKCIERDVKGLYGKAIRGLEKNVIGMDEPFEAPCDADLILNTGIESLEDSAKTIWHYLKQKSLISKEMPLE